ncbi:MAG: hypothetical protein NVSMB32_01000 [Actinomycetota bacterium]
MKKPVVDPSVLVRVHRKIRGAERLEGFVVGLGERWLLLQVLNPAMFLEGFAALRLRDVARIEARGPESVAVRALQLHGEVPSTAIPPLDLDSTAALLATAAALSPLVTIFVEDDYPDACFIGKVVRIGKKRVRLQEIDPEARWWRGRKWRLADISQVQIGGRYESALYEVGGDPTPSDRSRPQP